MFEREMTQTLTRRSTTGARSPRQSPGACRPTNQPGFAQTLLVERPHSLTLVPQNEARIAHTSHPSVELLRTPDESVAYPHAGLLSRLLTLLASEPEPDKLP